MSSPTLGVCSLFYFRLYMCGVISFHGFNLHPLFTLYITKIHVGFGIVYFLMMNWPLYHDEITSLCLVICCLKSAFIDVNITALAFFWLALAWFTFSNFIPLSYVILNYNINMLSILYLKGTSAYSWVLFYYPVWQSLHFSCGV